MVPMYKKGGKKKPMKKESWMEESKEIHFKPKPKMETGGLYTAAEKAKNIAKVKEMNSQQGPEHQTQVKKKTGGKSMEPGGGGRFAAMVSGLKKKGKSEDSAKAIAASIGRNKYGKSKFQAMAAAGKKGLGGASDSTGANEAGMEMINNTKKKRSEKVTERADRTMDRAKKNWTRAEAIKNFDKTSEGKNFAQDEFGTNASMKANQLYKRAERQGNKAGRQKEKADYLKASGRKTGGKK